MLFHSLEATLAHFGADAYEGKRPLHLSSNVSIMSLVQYGYGIGKEFDPSFSQNF